MIVKFSMYIIIVIIVFVIRFNYIMIFRKTKNVILDVTSRKTNKRSFFDKRDFVYSNSSI